MFLWIKQLLDWVYKPRCYICKNTTSEGVLCKDCYNEIDLLPPIQIKTINETKIYSVGLYSNNLRKLIRAIKYHKKAELAEPLAQLLYSQLQQLNLDKHTEIIPVPIHSKRLKERKYNHMDIIGKELGLLCGFYLNTQIIARKKDTQAQYKLSKKERTENLKDAFEILSPPSIDRQYLIIDDISTSGITIAEMSRTLRKKGAKKIIALVLSVPAH